MRSTTVVLLLASVALSCADAPRTGSSPGAQPPTADAVATKPAQRYARLDDALNAVASSERPFEVAAERGLRVRDGRIQVSILTEPARLGSLEAWLAERGASNLASAGDVVQAEVSVELLRALDRQPAVRAVRRPSVIHDPRLADPVQGKR
jgi:hypothetical protein